MRKSNAVIMTLAGLLLVAASILKFHELLTICVPSWTDNKYGFWESYEFLLIQIPLEFALGVWMVSGLFRKAAWIAGTLAYLGFIAVTIFKVVTGAESCGCFGQVHVNPWITLFSIDIPFFILLAIFRPKGLKVLPPPWPNVFYLLLVAVPTIGLMVLSTPALTMFRPKCLKAQQVQPDEAAKKALQEYLRKQQEARDKAAQEAMEQLPGNKDLSIGKLKIEASEQTDIFNLQVDNKDSLVLNIATPEKIIITPITPEQPTITVLENHVEIDWTTKIKPQETAIAEPTEATEPPAAAETQTAQAATSPTESSSLQEPTAETPSETPQAAQWEWLKYVVEEDVRSTIAEGLTVVLLYHHDCPVCADMVPKYSDYYRQMTEQGNIEFKIAFLAVPPLAESGPVPADTSCIKGKMTDAQSWQIMSPYVVALLDGQLVKTWDQGTAPEPETLLDQIFAH
jgi:hypothetical protein